MTATAIRTHRNGTTRDAPPRIRVAIYCRKSTEKGLEQPFNSLDAQREIVESYVASQCANGWVALPDQFDDGGFSGGDRERPALQRALAEVEAGRVDVLATARLDRLSRDQRHFFEIMDFLDQHGARFVSVQEQFNTTTAQGKFALSIAIAVAQLERETAALRTREKNWATRRRGLGTGGRPILGYDPAGGGKLSINAAEAEVVRRIFARFLECGSVLTIAQELREQGIRNKTWTNRKGSLVVGGPFDKGTLLHLLRNPLYAGRISLGEEQHEGAHESIVNIETWNAVQHRLRSNGSSGSARGRNRWNVLLAGLLHCGGTCGGAAMGHHYSSRNGRKVSYYVCQTAQKQGAAACPRSRLPVRMIEAAVVAHIKRIGQDEHLIKQVIEAAHRELETRGPKLEAELKRIDADRRMLTTERKNLTAAVGKGGEKVPALVERLRQVEESIQRLSQQAADARRQFDALADQTIDETDLRAALERFDPIWDELFPAEKARLLALLIERVTYDARTSEVGIMFHPGGVRSLAARGKGEDR